jgi:Domain of unknown function (DUF6456)
MRKPENPHSTAVATTPLAQAFMDRMRAGHSALRKRRNVWEILDPDGNGQKILPKSIARIVDALISAGALRCGDDGLFRPFGVAVRAVVDRQESPLQQLLSNRTQSGENYFTPDMVRAGEKLRLDFEKAHLGQRITTNFSMADNGSTRHWQFSDNAVERFADAVFAARQRVHDALDMVGPELSGVLLQVCCLTTGLEAAERVLALPRRSAKAILALGLTRLARHYGYRERLRHAGPTQIGHWATADYKPVISAPGPQPRQT